MWRFLLFVLVTAALAVGCSVSDTPEEELKRLARASEAVAKHLDGKEIVKEIIVPGRLVNLVVR